MGEVGAKSGEQFFDEKRLSKNQHAILDIFAWAVWCIFLRGDYTHRGASFKPLITKMGDRPVGPYPWCALFKLTNHRMCNVILDFV